MDTENIFLLVKSLHIIAVISWLAGLLYLPRLFVYHTRAQIGSEMDKTFQIMERKLLYIIIHPAMLVALLMGLSLGHFLGFDSTWIHIKISLVILLICFQFFLSKCRKNFAIGKNKYSEKFYRIIGEVPAILMIAIVFLVIFKPFDSMAFETKNINNNLVQITEKKYGVILDLRYATKNNFTKERIYNEPLCYLHKDAAAALKKAVALAKIQGYKIKIFDCFRPIEVQEHLFHIYPDGGFVSNPKTGLVTHCRGIAADLTLADKNDQELDMGTEFDNFTNLAYHDTTAISKDAQENRKILKKIMLDSGWDLYQNEWWHYQLPNPLNYSVVRNFRL